VNGGSASAVPKSSAQLELRGIQGGASAVRFPLPESQILRLGRHGDPARQLRAPKKAVLRLRIARAGGSPTRRDTAARRSEREQVLVMRWEVVVGLVRHIWRGRRPAYLVPHRRSPSPAAAVAALRGGSAGTAAFVIRGYAIEGTVAPNSLQPSDFRSASFELRHSTKNSDATEYGGGRAQSRARPDHSDAGLQINDGCVCRLLTRRGAHRNRRAEGRGRSGI